MQIRLVLRLELGLRISPLEDPLVVVQTVVDLL